MKKTFERDNHIFTIQEIIINGQKVWHLSIRPPMTDEEYDAIKYRLESIGGHWRERFGGFIFIEDPWEALNSSETWEPIEHSEYVKWRIERQFYPTPANIAERVVELCEIGENDTVLEPSAGRGALLAPIKKVKDIQAVELDENNANILKSKGYNVLNTSFEEAIENGLLHSVSKIVMNPPFSGQRDIKHILLAYELLSEGGTLVAIMSENDLYYNTPLTREFNIFLKEKNAYIEDIPMRGFAESNTSVDTIIVKLKK